MQTEETQKQVAPESLSLKERLVRDQGLAETQLKGVVRQLEEVQVTQQTLAKQKIALETLINYLRTVLATNASTDTSQRQK